MGNTYCPHCENELRYDYSFNVFYCVECEYVMPSTKPRKRVVSRGIQVGRMSKLQMSIKTNARQAHPRIVVE